MTTSPLILRRRRLRAQVRFDVRPNPASLEAIAAQLGVRASTLHRWERGSVRRPPVAMLRAWTEAIEALERRAKEGTCTE